MLLHILQIFKRIKPAYISDNHSIHQFYYTVNPFTFKHIYIKIMTNEFSI
jgi:hypothetical protein